MEPPPFLSASIRIRLRISSLPLARSRPAPDRSPTPVSACSSITPTPTHQISQVDFDSRTATVLPTLGPFTNSINDDTVLVASPHGAFIMAAMPDGTLLLYDSSADTFTVARKDYPSLSGAYAASDTGQFAIDNNILNQSLSRIAVLDKGMGGTSGFAFAGSTVFRTTGPVSAGTTASAAGGPLNTPR